VASLGGPADFVEHAQKHLPAAPVQRACLPERPGIVTAMNTRAVGVAVVALGGGRRRADDTIDYSVGLTEMCALGEGVDSDRPIAIVHAADADAAEDACRALRAAISIGEKAPAASPTIIEWVRES